MSLRMKCVLLAWLGCAIPSLGQEPVAVQPPVVAPPAAAGAPTFSGMIFEEPSDWWPVESQSNYWLTGEYWFGWIDDTSLPPLVTTSPAGTPTTTAGILGLATTSTLLSGPNKNDDVRPGFRFQGGYWLDHDMGVRLEAGTSYLASQSSQFDYNSADFPIIARPYTEITLNALTPAPNDTISTPQAFLIAHPDPANGSTGSLRITAKAGTYHDANFDLVESMYRSERTNIDTIFGYRFGHFSDQIRFQQRIVPNAVPGTIDSSDEFSASNIFHGLDFGFRGEIEQGDLGLTLMAKMAAGILRREVDIAGQQTSTTAAGSVTNPGGVFAIGPNLGRRQDSEFTIFPEYGATLHWKVKQNFRVHVGYRGMILFDAVRAADQIDMSLNPDFLPPVANPNSRPRRPRTPFHDDKLWIQSLSLGAEWIF